MNKNLFFVFFVSMALAACGGGDDTADLCSDNPCQNGGTCSTDGSSASCECAEGFEGDLCETATGGGETNNNNNNGECAPVTDCDDGGVDESDISTALESSCSDAGGQTVRYLTGLVTDGNGLSGRLCQSASLHRSTTQRRLSLPAP